MSGGSRNTIPLVGNTGGAFPVCACSTVPAPAAANTGTNVQRHLILAGTLALGLAACDDRASTADAAANVAADALEAAAHSDAETTAEHLAAVTAEAERIEREYITREDAENRRRLDLIGADAPPDREAAYVPDPLNDWFAMNPEHIFCDSLTGQTGDRNPDQFIGKLLANGGSIMRLDLGDGAIQVIDQNDPRPFTTIVFVRGLENCRAYLRRAREQTAR